MKRLLFGLALAAGLVAAPAAKADDYTMSLTSTNSSATSLGRVSFDGTGGFSFGSYNNNTSTYTAGGYSFAVASVYDSSNPGVSDALTLQGKIIGSFSIGTVFSDSTGEYASVTTNGPASFVISDGSGHDLTANLTFSSIETTGTATTINDSGTVNLSNFQYTGTNQNLLDLTTHLDGGTLSITFTFPGTGQTLDQLKSTAELDSYQGSLSAAPAPPSCVLMLTGGLLSGLGFLRRRIFRLA